MIGQLFEYAAALWKLEIEDSEQSLAEGGTPSRDPVIDSPRWQEAAFRSTVSDNLSNGAFQLIIAVDEITERLKRTVVFINCRTPLELRGWSCPAQGRPGTRARRGCSTVTTVRRSAPIRVAGRPTAGHS